MFDRHGRFLLFLGIAAASVGCGGPDVAALCEAQESCVGGNEADINACVAAFEGFEDLASDIGCSDEFDAHWTCQQENAACRDLNAGGTCMNDADCGNDVGVRCSGGQCVAKFFGFDPAVTESPCEPEENAYQRCF
jgi:hypothetical protein